MILTIQTRSIVILSLLLSACVGSKELRQFGIYKFKSGGTALTLKADSTFIYRRQIHIDGLTASGNYKLNADTLILNYTDRNYDSIISPPHYLIITTLGEALSLPKKFLWKGKGLYLLINDGTKLKIARFKD